MKTSKAERLEEYSLLVWRNENGRLFAPADVRRYLKLRGEFTKGAQVDLKPLKVAGNQ